MSAWSPEHLGQLDLVRELSITTARRDGTLRPAVPIWVVVVDGAVFVRTWRPRRTGWYGHAVAARLARITLPALDLEVVVDPVGPFERAAIDAAYGAKYGTGGGMTAAPAVESTLRLSPA